MKESERKRLTKKQLEASDYMAMRPRPLRHNIATVILENPEGHAQTSKEPFFEKSWVNKGGRNRLFLNNESVEELAEEDLSTYQTTPVKDDS